MNNFFFLLLPAFFSAISCEDVVRNPFNTRHKRQLARALGSVYKFVSENSCSNGQRCYRELGCFHCRYGYHVEPPKKVNPRFYFYAPGQDMREIDFFGHLEASVDRLKFSKIKGDLWVIIHGFNPGPWPIPWTIQAADALVNQGHNVLLMNWVAGVAYPNYLQCASNARLLAAMLGRVLLTIEKRKRLPRRSMTLVGFSMGTHVAGWTGERVRGIRRIIALDPAGPLFTGADAVHRLDPTDAYYVQAIHTNGNNFFKEGGLGTLQPFGHVDYYANGGQLQPGCPKSEQLVIVKDLEKLVTEVCHHEIACGIFIESVKQYGKGADICKYHSYPCESVKEWNSGHCFKCPNGSCYPVGYAAAIDLSLKMRGKFFFSTYDKETCGHQFLVLVQPNSDVKGVVEVGLQDAASDNFVSRVISEKSLSGNQLHAVNLAANFAKPSQALIHYEKSSPALLGLLGSGGQEQWYIKGVTVIRADKQRYDSVEPQLAQSGFTTQMQLVTKL